MITASGSMWSLAAMETRARWASTFRPAAPACRLASVLPRAAHRAAGSASGPSGGSQTFRAWMPAAARLDALCHRGGHRRPRQALGTVATTMLQGRRGRGA